MHSLTVSWEHAITCLAAPCVHDVMHSGLEKLGELDLQLNAGVFWKLAYT